MHDEEALYKISEVARAAKLTVRALRHADILRLQQIRAQRELGFGLEAIKAQLDAPDYDMRLALETQRASLTELVEETHAMIAAIDRSLAALADEVSPLDLASIFDGFDPAAHEVEVEARWGQTDAFAESTRRTAAYDERDWREIKGEGDAILADFAARLAAGDPPDADAVLALAERYRLHIDARYYPCSREMHAQVAELYVEDPRFTATFDAVRPGLAHFVADAVRINALARGD